jgi:hypothetical protein
MTITTTTTTTETEIFSPSQASVPSTSNASQASEHPNSNPFPTPRASISSYASHPDDLRKPLPNDTVNGFFVVFRGREPGIFFTKRVIHA